MLRYWKEIFTTTDFLEYTKAQKILENQKIPVKVKISSIRDRMSNNIILGGNPFILNTMGMTAPPKEYRLFTKKEFISSACKLISEK